MIIISVLGQGQKEDSPAVPLGEEGEGRTRDFASHRFRWFTFLSLELLFL